VQENLFSLPSQTLFPLSEAEACDQESAEGVKAADMGEFISHAGNEQNDRERQTKACTRGIGQNSFGVELFPDLYLKGVPMVSQKQLT
jgi:hypothetical protein